MLLVDSLIVAGLATISLGTIHEADGPIERSFWMRNTGSKPAALVQGYTSCGCTTIDYEKDRLVQPGDSTCITLRFNPRGKGGEFLETATITYVIKDSADSKQSPMRSQSSMRNVQSSMFNLQCSMSGTCITSEETLLQQFPIRISDDLRLSTNRFDLGYMKAGETKERGVVVLHRDERDRKERIAVRFTATNDLKPGIQHIIYPIKTMERGKMRSIDIILDVIIDNP